MKKGSKRILALLLTVIIIASCVQLNVFAADDTTSTVSLEVAVQNDQGIDLSDRDDDKYEFSVYGVDEATGNAMTDESFTYDVFDVKTDDVVAQAQTVKHEGTFKLEGGQRAVFYMKTGASYTFTEKQGATQRFIPTAEFNGEDVNLSFEYSVETGTITENQTYDIDFINILTPTTVTLKYYDRVIEQGQPSDISPIAKSVSYDFYGAEVEYNESNYEISNSAELILTAADKLGLNKLGNILDDYILYTSTEDAANDIKNNYINYHTGANYIYTEYHTNNYGYTQDDTGVFADGSKGDKEKWVTVNSDENTIDVWIFNTPKRYTVKTFGVIDETTANALVPIGDGKYVNTTENSAKTTIAYYNQRMGQKPTTGAEIDDDTTNHLSQYDIDGYTGVTATTNETATTYDGTDVDFLYWAFDTEGVKVASTDLDYNQRIASDTTLYAVYGSGTKKPNGVTLRENGYDVYADNGVSRIRLNSVLNPYGTLADSKATKISDVAIIYVNMKNVADNKIADEIKHIQGQLKTVLTENNTYEISGKDVALSDGSTTEVKGFSYEVVDKPTSSSQVYLTSKNRVQLSTSFKMSQFENLRLCSVAAVCVNGEWIITDNYNDYLPSSYLN